jgi:ubiquitin carboxyl-terminal hydrolase 8
MKFKFLLFLLLPFYSNLLFAGQPVVPRSILNLGATCYMNSVLQCLNQVEPLVQFLRSRCTGYYKPESLSKKFADLITKIHTEEPKLFDILAFCRPMFEKFFAGSAGQQDAQEFLSKLLDHLSDTDIIDSELKKIGLYDTRERVPKSEVNQLFASLIRSTVTAAAQEEITHSADKIISVALEKSVALSNKNQQSNISEYFTAKKKDITLEYKTIQECLRAYFAQEDLEKNEWVKRGGKQVPTSRKLSIITPAPFLVIHLKRNIIMGKYPHLIALKLTHAVSFPLNQLDISPYTIVSPALKKSELVYDLMGIVQHVGSFEKTDYGFSSSGHYTAYVKNRDTWYFCDDSKIEQISRADMEKIAQVGGDGSFTPYILFYKRQNIPQFQFASDPTCATLSLDELFALSRSLNALV